MNTRIFKTFTAAICLTMLAAGTASAGAVCLSDGVAPYRFSKLKLPKKAGDTTGFVGVRYSPLGVRPVIGVATKVTSGATVLSFQTHSDGINGNDFSATWVAMDSTLAGTAYYDNDGDFVKDDGMLTMSIIDCDTVTVP
jgi:hypothetical protein